jgi:hypothetical protein
MKASRLKQPKPFEPVELLLTFENEDEVGIFRAMFNYYPLTQAIKKVSPTFNDDLIRESLKEYAGGNYWDDFRMALEKIMK